MTNPGNLKKGKDTEFLTGEEQARIAQKGGIASGKSRREGKLFKGLLDRYLENPEKDIEKIKETLDDANIQGAKKEEITNAVIMMASLINKAKGGDIKAIEFIRDTIGEKPSDKIDYTQKEVEFDEEDEADMKEALMEKYNLVEKTN